MPHTDASGQKYWLGADEEHQAEDPQVWPQNCNLCLLVSPWTSHPDTHLTLAECTHSSVAADDNLRSPLQCRPSPTHGLRCLAQSMAGLTSSIKSLEQQPGTVQQIWLGSASTWLLSPSHDVSSAVLDAPMHAHCSSQPHTVCNLHVHMHCSCMATAGMESPSAISAMSDEHTRHGLASQGVAMPYIICNAPCSLCLRQTPIRLVCRHARLCSKLKSVCMPLYEHVVFSRASLEGI